MSAPKKRKATHRLRDMQTEEISLVDRPANERPFIVTKSIIVPGATTKAMALPSEARSGLIAGVSDSLEILTGATAALKESTVDDSAAVPPELPRMLRDAAKVLIATADEAEGTAPRRTDEDGESEMAKTALAKAIVQEVERAIARGEIADLAGVPQWLANVLALRGPENVLATVRPSDDPSAEAFREEVEKAMRRAPWLDFDQATELVGMTRDMAEHDRVRAARRADWAAAAKRGPAREPSPAWPEDLSAAVMAKESSR